MTQEGDVVLVHMDGNPAFFARIEEIGPDPKPDWFQVKMLVLQIPLMVITWILRDVYIDGGEFTMGGRPVRLEKVVAPAENPSLEIVEDEPAPEPKEETVIKAAEETEKPQEPGKEEPERGKVVSLFDRSRKRHSL
ncbi:MAG: hypothetical protein AB7W37_13480 [Syntrophobacteraceae bacterium]